MIIRFSIYGSRNNKELNRFIDFVVNKYKNISDETISITLSGLLGQAVLETERKMTDEQIEKARFMLENEFAKHFSNVSVEVSII
jgi:hypothetical protein